VPKNLNTKKNIKFGCYIYQDSLKYKDILRIALECEKLGYDSVWLKDNFIPWIQDYIHYISNTGSNTNNSSDFQPYHPILSMQVSSLRPIFEAPLYSVLIVIILSSLLLIIQSTDDAC